MQGGIWSLLSACWVAIQGSLKLIVETNPSAKDLCLILGLVYTWVSYSLIQVRPLWHIISCWAINITKHRKGRFVPISVPIFVPMFVLYCTYCFEGWRFSYVVGNGRTQIKRHATEYHRSYSVHLYNYLTLNRKIWAEIGFALNHITGGSIFLSRCCRHKYLRIWQTSRWKKLVFIRCL